MNSETLTSPPLTQPSTNWLDRLRSAKGYPDHSSYTNLEHFLSSTLHPHPHPPPPPPPTRHHDVTPYPPLPKNDVITNILSDLFYFNNESSSSSNTINKKSNRKQMCPRSCVIDVSNGRRKAKKVIRGMNENEGDEKEGDWEDYTQTEVTVIDTSVLEWKFDKVLYRRKNVWKVGDKKKRKENVNANEDEDEDGRDVYKMKNKKKLKVCKLSKNGDGEDSGEEKKRKKKRKKKLKLCSSLKYVDKEDIIVGSKGYDQGKTMVSAYEKKQDNCRQVQEKRVLKNQIDGGSSVILIKSIPTTNKKDMSGISKSCAKSMQK